MEAVHPGWYIVGTVGIALLPLFLGLCTSYLKISVVLNMIRSGIGAQQVPSGLVTMALSVALTLFVFGPLLNQTAQMASGVGWPSLSEAPSSDALEQAAQLIAPWKTFLRSQTGDRELAIFRQLAQQCTDCIDDSRFDRMNGSEDEPSLFELLPAFLVSELKEAFAIGFVVLLPMLVVDLIVANVLMGLGMFMVSPVMVSLPIKLFLFVVSDAWVLLTNGLVHSYVVT